MTGEEEQADQGADEEQGGFHTGVNRGSFIILPDEEELVNLQLL